MTCHTDNAEAEKAYLHFVENIEPETQAAAVRAGKDLSRAIRCARTDCRCRVTKFSIATPKITSNCSAGECAARNRGSQTRPAISKTQRLADGALSRRRKDADADGQLSRRTGSRAAAGSVGTGRQAAACRSARSSRSIFDELLKLREQIAKNAGLRQLPRLRLQARGRV